MTANQERGKEDDELLFVVCQGPPFCSLIGEAAIQHQNNGCLQCKRMSLYEAAKGETLQ